MKKQAIVFCLGVLILMPIVVLATELNSYRIDSGGETYYVHYGGFVPCGKDVWVSDNPDGLNGSTVHIPCQFCHLFVMLSAIVSFLLTTFVPLLAVGMLILAGIMYYLALGNPGKVTKANKLLVGIFLGLFLIYGAWLIVGALFSVIGVAEWTGLRGGWYQIGCPLKYIAFEAVEPISTSGICLKDGPVEGWGVLCSGGRVMSGTLPRFDNQNGAERACSDFRLRVVVAGKRLEGLWVVPSLADYQSFWATNERYLRCGGDCRSWDPGCCRRSDRYWSKETKRAWNMGIDGQVFVTDGRGAGGTLWQSAGGSSAHLRCIFVEE